MIPTVLYLILIGKLYFFISISGKTRIIELPMEPLYVKASHPVKLVCEQTDGFKTVWVRFLKSDINKGSMKSESTKYKVIPENAGFFQKSLNDEGRFLNAIFTRSFEKSDSGSYCCNVLSSLDRSYCVDVYVLEVLNHDGIMLKVGDRTVIGCQLNFDSKIFPEITWSKEGKKIVPDKAGKKYFINSTWTDSFSHISQLVVFKTGEQDVGRYHCELKLTDNVQFYHDVNLFSAPNVKIIDKSISITEQSRTKVVCSVWGWPLPVVKWYVGTRNHTINVVPHTSTEKQLKGNRIYAKNYLFSERSDEPKSHDESEMRKKDFIQFPSSSSLLPSHSSLTSLNSSQSVSSHSSTPSSPTMFDAEEKNSSSRMSSEKPFPPPAGNSHSGNSTLYIMDAKLIDREFYICEASAEMNDSLTLRSEAVIMIRVKGRYAFLYPLVGIIVETVILMIIIIIYERNKHRERNRQEIIDENNLFQPLVTSSGEEETTKFGK